MTDILMCGENPIGQVSEYTAGETIKSDSIAPVESLVSLHAYAKDDLLVYNGELYIATSAIAVGDTITSKIERTSTTSYVNPTRMNHIEDGIEAVDGKTASDIPYTTGSASVKQVIDSLIPTRTQFTPNYGASSDLGYRNFFLTDNSTFLEIHFCLRCQTAINADVDLITLPTIAQNKTPQYGVGIETSNNKSHIVYNNGNYMYLDSANITADFNGVFAGTFRMSLI